MFLLHFTYLLSFILYIYPLCSLFFSLIRFFSVFVCVFVVLAMHCVSVGMARDRNHIFDSESTTTTKQIYLCGTVGYFVRLKSKFWSFETIEAITWFKLFCSPFPYSIGSTMFYRSFCREFHFGTGIYVTAAAILCVSSSTYSLNFGGRKSLLADGSLAHYFQLDQYFKNDCASVYDFGLNAPALKTFYMRT